MFKVVCRTNLDLAHEEWPGELPALPNVGDHIQSGVDHNGFRLELQVKRITWEKHLSHESYPWHGAWIPHIELHMTEYQRRMPPRDSHNGEVADGSITAFYQWYAPKVGRSVGAFI